MQFNAIVQLCATAFQAVGVGVLVGGAALALASFVAALIRPRGTGASLRGAYRLLRRDLGRAILLGLEFLVAADIIRSIAIAPTLQNVVVLAVIVLIRTFLSWSLEVEITGHWPWQSPRAGRTARQGPEGGDG